MKLHIFTFLSTQLMNSYSEKPVDDTGVSRVTSQIGNGGSCEIPEDQETIVFQETILSSRLTTAECPCWKWQVISHDLCHRVTWLTRHMTSTWWSGIMSPCCIIFGWKQCLLFASAWIACIISIQAIFDTEQLKYFTVIRWGFGHIKPNSYLSRTW